MDVMLLGRVTYEIFAGYLPTATVDDDPMAERMNQLPVGPLEDAVGAA